MLQVMDNMEASFVLYVKVGTFTYLEQSKISLLTINKSGIGKQTEHYDLIVSVRFIQYNGNYLRQSLADVVLLGQYAPHI